MKNNPSRDLRQMNETTLFGRQAATDFFHAIATILLTALLLTASVWADETLSNSPVSPSFVPHVKSTGQHIALHDAHFPEPVFFTPLQDRLAAIEKERTLVLSTQSGSVS